MKTTSLITGLCLLFSIYTFAQKNDYSFKETYNLATPATLKVSVSDGFINVYPSETDKTEVYFIVKKGSSLQKISKDELDEFVSLIINIYPDNLEITIKHRNNNNWKAWENSYNVSCEIYTPAETSCDLRSSDGDILIKGLNANQKCITSDGDVVAARINGNINCTTSDGDVQIYNVTGNTNLATSDGDVKAENVEGDTKFVTSDGDVNLVNVTGTINARTSDGDISFIDCSGSVIAQTSDGDIEGNIIKLKVKLSVITSDGDIDVTIPEGLSFDVKLKGSDLNIPLIDFSGKSEEHLIQGTVRGGGIPIELMASDGSVSLNYN